MSCSTIEQSFVPIPYEDHLQPTDKPTDGHGRVRATENYPMVIKIKQTKTRCWNLENKPLMSCSTLVPSFDRIQLKEPFSTERRTYQRMD